MTQIDHSVARTIAYFLLIVETLGNAVFVGLKVIMEYLQTNEDQAVANTLECAILLGCASVNQFANAGLLYAIDFGQATLLTYFIMYRMTSLLFIVMKSVGDTVRESYFMEDTLIRDFYGSYNTIVPFHTMATYTFWQYISLILLIAIYTYYIYLLLACLDDIRKKPTSAAANSQLNETQAKNTYTDDDDT